MNKKKNALQSRLEHWRFRMETRRWQFWGRMMDHHPRFYKWASEHLPFDTLPF